MTSTSEKFTHGASVDKSTAKEAPLVSLPRVLLVEELAKLHRVSEKTVRLWIRTGKLRVLPNCRPYRIPVSELARIEKGELK